MFNILVLIYLKFHWKML